MALLIRSHANPVAQTLRPMLSALLAADAAVDIEFWDGSALRADSPAGAIRVHSPRALQHIIWSPRELGLARAYVSGDVDFDGDIIDLMAELRTSSPQRASLMRTFPEMLRAVNALGLAGRRPPLPRIQFRPHVLRNHTPFLDAQAISHHYDVSNDFYAMLLGHRRHPVRTSRIAAPTSRRRNWPSVS